MKWWPQTREEELRRRRDLRSVLRANGIIIAVTALLMGIMLAGLTVENCVQAGSIEPLLHWQGLALLLIVGAAAGAGVAMYRHGVRIDPVAPDRRLPAESELPGQDPRRRLSKRARSAIHLGFLLLHLTACLGFGLFGMAAEQPAWLRPLLGGGGILVSLVGLRLLQHRITGQ